MSAALLFLLVITIIVVIWKPWKVIPHYVPSKPLSPKELCRLHGWNTTDQPPKTYDAIIFSVELDLLEIRLRELYPVVDHFVILESNTTFTGNPKPYHFDDNKNHLQSHSGRLLKPGESPFVVENSMRVNMTMHLVDIGIKKQDLVIMADVDEIPSRESISLLQTCHFQPNVLHLRMQNFIYSFDFLADMDHWRAKIVRVPDDFEEWFFGEGSKITPTPPFYYGHSRSSNHILSDAGWHCSFCFPRLSDFVFKMTAYSHADRVTNKKLLNPERIQRVICEGKDIFGMMPEAYTYRELLWKWGPAKKLESVRHVPKFVLENIESKRFSYLLPGGCMRDY
ncbi:glycosyl transferase [Chytridium lagenaria]|nr:glycosyl transferase [Chytridium lagenaria]